VGGVKRRPPVRGSTKKRGKIPDGRAIVGRNLRRLRKARGLSQEALAAEAGVDRTYMSTCERGLRNISVDNIYKLAWALDADVRELFDADA
jgi:transcriptional regulator with XRE-family HTH domain